MLNRGHTYVEVAENGAESLSAYLAQRHRHTTRPEWQARIEGGLVQVNGRPARADEAVPPGASIAWHRPPWEEPDVPLDFAVLFEDDDVLAVAKPSGLPTLPGGGFLENTLLERVRSRFPGAAPVHRLGRGTSGVVLFARTSSAARSLALAWRERRVVKVYRALVQGAPAQDAFVVETPIGPVAHPIMGQVHAASPTGKASRSEVVVLRRSESGSLVEVRIETGRPHQIRIHMAACGHPLVGDPLYVAGGGFQAEAGARPGDIGYLLHAMRLLFPHPADGRSVEVFCEPPASLADGRSARDAGEVDDGSGSLRGATKAVSR